MKTIKFENKYYVGAIVDYAICHDAIEFSIEKGKIYVTREQEFYLPDSHKTKTIKGKALLDDLMFKNNICDLQELATDVETHYKAEFFIDEVPHCLQYKTITIDGKDFKYSNLTCKDKDYISATETVDSFCGLVSMPSKLLENVLKQKPFKKV